MVYDIMSLINIVLAIAGVFVMLRLASKFRSVRAIFQSIAGFCFVAASFYLYILIESPDIGVLTAGIGRGIVILLLAAVIMLGTVMEK
jgi:uncharacterized MnhB-related membrane protein